MSTPGICPRDFWSRSTPALYSFSPGGWPPGPPMSTIFFARSAASAPSPPPSASSAAINHNHLVFIVRPSDCAAAAGSRSGSGARFLRHRCRRLGRGFGIEVLHQFRLGDFRFDAARGHVGLGEPDQRVEHELALLVVAP